MKGDVRFDPGANFITQSLDYQFDGDGTCTGELDGVEVTDIEVQAEQSGVSEGSCAEAHTTRPGAGRLTFASGEILDYTLEFTYRIPETDFIWYGSHSGTAGGTGTFRTDRTPPDTTAKCATPGGVTDIPMDITIETDTPLVSRNRS